MHDIVTTRHNPMIDPSLHIWSWEIPLYLFLGGMVAGMMVILGYSLYKGRHTEAKCSCSLLPGLSIILLSLGMLALFLDLEHRWYFWRMYATFQPTSPMSWGSWILLLVYPALIAGMLVRPPRPLESRSQAWKAVSARLHADPGAVKIIGTANMALGVLLGIYTGILLSAFGTRPLWNSALLGPLFLLSGLSSAAAFVHLVARDPQERIMLAKADNAFLGGEMVVIVFFLIGLLSSTRVHIEAANLILTGPFAPAFWVLVVGLGLLIPFVIQMMAVNHRIRHTAVAPIMVIAGGLLLRFVIVNAGQASHWTRALLTR